MTRFQYFLLHSVKFGPEPIKLVASDKQGQAGWFGFTFPYDDKEEIVMALDELCQKNLMNLGTWVEDYNYTIRENPTADVIKSGFNDRSIYYSLTPEGGALWEQEFKVDWNKYVSVSLTFFKNDDRVLVVDIASSLLENLELYLESRYSHTCLELEPEQRSLEILEPWHVTYWKTLPVGYATICHFIQNPVAEIITPANRDRFKWFEWYDDKPLGFKNA